VALIAALAIGAAWMWQRGIATQRRGCDGARRRIGHLVTERQADSRT
jgi:hypothetical protein